MNLQDKRQAGWFWEVNEIFDAGLTVHEILVRAFLSSRSTRNKQSTVSIETVSERCRISRSTVMRALTGLEKKGWIKRKRQINDEGGLHASKYVLLRKDFPDAPIVIEEDAFIDDAEPRSKKTKAAVWDKTHGKCFYCQKELNPWSDFTIDHVVPKSKGGSDTLDNFVPACRNCNSRKGSKDYEEFVGGAVK